MLSANMGLTTAALFTGAAAYITFAQQPARLQLDDRPLLTEWKPSYRMGAVMQGSLAVFSAALGFYTAWKSKDWRWNIPGGLMLANWPVTLLLIAPVNKKLLATKNEDADANSRALIRTWGSLHSIRVALGGAATAAYLWILTCATCKPK